MRLGTAITTLALSLIAAPAVAQAPSACMKFEEPLAYNACLARQGPKAAATRSGREPRGAPREAGVQRGPHGRMRAVFSIEPRPK